MQDLIGPVNDLDFVGWYDDMILRFQKYHSGRIEYILLVVVRENVGKAGWEAVSTLQVRGDGSMD